MIWRIYYYVYGFVWIISSLSSKSNGIPWGLSYYQILPFVIGSSNVSDPSVSCQYDHRGCLALQCPIQKWETFHIKHVDLVNKKNSWDNLSFSLLSPLRHFFINLLSDLLCNLTSGTRKQG